MNNILLLTKIIYLYIWENIKLIFEIEYASIINLIAIFVIVEPICGITAIFYICVDLHNSKCKFASFGDDKSRVAASEA